MQSLQAGVVLDSLLSVLWQQNFFSPIAGLTEFRILAELFSSHIGLMNLIQSCFWGRWCGQCAKCTRYALAQCLAEVRCLQFSVDPLSDLNPSLTTFASMLAEPDVPYILEVRYYLSRLLLRGDLGRSPRVAAAVEDYLRIAGQPLEEMERELMTKYNNELAPAGFNS